MRVNDLVFVFASLVLIHIPRMQKTQRALATAKSKTIDVAEDVKEKLTTSIENIKYPKIISSTLP